MNKEANKSTDSSESTKRSASVEAYKPDATTPETRMMPAKRQRRSLKPLILLVVAVLVIKGGMTLLNRETTDPTPAAPLTQPQEYSTYTSANGVVSVKYPTGWHTSESNKTDAYTANLLFRMYKDGGLVYPELTVDYNPIGLGEAKTVAEGIEKSKRAGFREVYTKTFNGVEYVHFKATPGDDIGGQENEASITIEGYSTMKNGMSTAVLITVLPGQENILTMLDTIMESVKVTDSI